MKKLLPNTIEGLHWGMKNFDGVEFDIRLAKNNELVIHHDPINTNGKLIEEMDHQELQLNNIALFRDFISHEQTMKLLSENKTLWIELKPNCNGKKPVETRISQIIYNSFLDEIDETKINNKQLRLISFSKTLLSPFAENDGIRCFPILPYINECNPKLVFLKGLTRLLFKSLDYHIDEALKRNFRGILFARQYLLGIFSKRHRSYAKMVEMITDNSIEFGSNLGSIDLEVVYPKLHRFSDHTHQYPRYADSGEGEIIAHRGTGTKGIELSD